MDRPDAPIFVHSMFRSGSTYFFQVFRRSHAKYWCYQEPLNEVLLDVSQHAALMEGSPGGPSALLRHPDLSQPYLWEFRAIREVLPRLLDKGMIYDSFFSERPDDQSKLVAYFNALARVAEGRPVFQECRTFCRARGISDRMGGVHLYLWRNPWDQWWSNKINPYFDLAYLRILNATNPPAWIRLLKQRLQYVDFHGATLEQEGSFLSAQLPDAERSYLLFYSIWCYALSTNSSSAHCMINIDSLTNSEEYRRSTIADLARLGIAGLDFSDCASPQSPYSARERRFFAKVEQEAHDLLREAGLAEAVEAAARARAEHIPAPGAGAAGRALFLVREQCLALLDEALSLKRQVRQQGELLDRITRSFEWRAWEPVRRTLRFGKRLLRLGL